MAKDVNISLASGHPNLGKIKIAPRVLEIIASIAAVQVKGVNRMRGSFTNSVNELFGHRRSGKGIRLAFNQHHQLVVDIYVYVNYGYSVPQVALKIQDKVKQQLYFMSELSVEAVNVHVSGIVPKKSVAHVDPNRLFNQNQGESK